jgi:tryptophan synthase alpha chain
MSRFADLFARVALERRIAFVPFYVLGDPTPDESLAALEALVRGGADALELGIPFSDPIADGPVIQAAAVRALAAGTTPAACFALLTTFRARHPDIPIGLLVYANLVEARGRDAFYRRAADAGVDAVLVADVPTVEAPPFCDDARAHGVDPVLIATPRSHGAELARIAALTRGYTYVVTRTGVTGADKAAGGDYAVVGELAALGAPPALLGFGISTPEHVSACAHVGAGGVISGSAVVRLVEKHRELDQRLAALEAFVAEMRAAAAGTMSQ